MTNRSLIELVQKPTGYSPINNTDTVLGFEKGVKVTNMAQLLHSIDSWVGYKVEVGCFMVNKKQLVKVAKDIEEHRKAVKKLERRQKIEKTNWILDFPFFPGFCSIFSILPVFLLNTIIFSLQFDPTPSPMS